GRGARATAPAVRGHAREPYRARGVPDGAAARRALRRRVARPLLVRGGLARAARRAPARLARPRRRPLGRARTNVAGRRAAPPHGRLRLRSEEHTSELQSLRHLVCRLLLEKKKKKKTTNNKNIKEEYTNTQSVKYIYTTPR